MKSKIYILGIIISLMSMAVMAQDGYYWTQIQNPAFLKDVQQKVEDKLGI
jgi:uncharacterized protein YtpQ (UPF0354 family)